MAGTARVLVIKKNNKLQTYPTYEVLQCDKMSAVASHPDGGSIFTYGGTGKTQITTKYVTEQTPAQIKALCNRCCESTSA